MAILNQFLSLFTSFVPIWNNYLVYIFALMFLATTPYIIYSFFDGKGRW